MRWRRKENRKSRHPQVPASKLLNVAVVVNVVFTVAVVAFATGAVPEFQFRIADIGSAADGTPVGVGCFGLCLGGFVGACVELDYLGLFLSGLFSSELALGVDPPGQGQYIQHTPEPPERVRVLC